MNGDSYNIRRAEGGFIVSVSKLSEEATNFAGVVETERVFADSASLLNFLHNELVGE